MYFKLIFLFPIIILACVPKKIDTTVITFAGTGSMGKADGARSQSSFANPMGLAIDKDDNVYVADAQNNLIRKIDSLGNTSTLAGTGEVGSNDGEARNATFFYPTSLAVDKEGNIFVADTQNNLIRKINRKGIVSTLAKHSKIRFDKPAGLAIDAKGNIYVSDFSNRIRKIMSEESIVSVAGTGERGNVNGESSKSTFYVPKGMAFDNEGSLLICDSYNNQIRKIDSTGKVSTLTGKSKKGAQNGSLDSASFFHPQGLAVANDGAIFIADAGNNLIRKINSKKRVIKLAGNGQRGYKNGDRETSLFWNPMGVAIDKSGHLYVADYQNNVIRKIKL